MQVNLVVTHEWFINKLIPELWKVLVSHANEGILAHSFVHVYVSVCDQPTSIERPKTTDDATDAALGINAMR